MPYKTKKDRRKYDKRYHKFKTEQLKAVRKALDTGNVTRARRILDKKPNIHVKKRGKRRKK